MIKFKKTNTLVLKKNYTQENNKLSSCSIFVIPYHLWIFITCTT